MISHSRLLQLFLYDPLSGIFTRRVTTGSRSKAGDVAGSVNNRGYLRISIDGKHYACHILAWFYVNGEWPKSELDHDDRVKTNNRIGNLVESTHSQNMQNVGIRKDNTSGFRGVHFDSGVKKYRTSAMVDGSRVSLGCFDSAESAHKARVGYYAELSNQNSL